MIPSEWLTIAASIKRRWPHSVLEEPTIRQWGSDLEDLPGEAVAAAYEAAYREGERFPPNGGQIRLKVVQLTLDPPEFTEVLSEIAAAARHPASVAHAPDVEGGPLTHTYPRRERLARAHPLIRQFVGEIGWEQVNVGGGSDEARLRQKWEGFVARQLSDATHLGIKAPPAMRGLHRPRRGELHSATQALESFRKALAPGPLPAEIEEAEVE